MARRIFQSKTVIYKEWGTNLTSVFKVKRQFQIVSVLLSEDTVYPLMPCIHTFYSRNSKQTVVCARNSSIFALLKNGHVKNGLLR